MGTNEDESMSSKSQEEIKEIGKCSIRFYMFAFGFVLNYCPYTAVVSLQSSINLQESLGTLSLGVAMVVSMVYLIFVIPATIRKFGSKPVMLTGDVLILLYIAANFYPAFFTLIPAAVCIGIADASIWTALPMYFVHFGTVRGKYSKGDNNAFARKYTGLFIGIFQIGQLCNYAVSYAVMTFGKNRKGDSGFAENSNATKFPREPNSRYQHCASNDCQDQNVTSSDLSLYVPASNLVLYILLGTYSVLVVCGTMIHAYFLPTTRPEGTHKATEEKEISLFLPAEKEEKKKQEESLNITKNINTPGYVETIKATFKHILCIEQLLLFPFLLYYGTTITFVGSELNRAYTSCIIGVEKIGLTMIGYGIFAGISSTASGKLIEKFGRNIILFILLILESTNYTFCLLWKPQESTSWLVYLIFMGFGTSDSLRLAINLAIHSEYFKHNQEIAFASVNIGTTIGIAIQYLWSPLLCVSAKIYIQVALLSTSTLCYVAVEYHHRARRPKEEV